MKNILASASIIALLVASPALAQTANPDATKTPPIAEKMEPSKPAMDAKTDPMNKAPVTASNVGEWRASKLIGANVYSAGNENIGDINELIIDGSGKITRVIVGVGGFLGMGERNVALDFGQLNFAYEKDAVKISSSFTKDSLRTMPVWDASKWDADNRTATPSTNMRPVR